MAREKVFEVFFTDIVNEAGLSLSPEAKEQLFKEFDREFYSFVIQGYRDAVRPADRPAYDRYIGDNNSGKAFALVEKNGSSPNLVLWDLQEKFKKIQVAKLREAATQTKKQMPARLPAEMRPYFENLLDGARITPAPSQREPMLQALYEEFVTFLDNHLKEYIVDHLPRSALEIFIIMVKENRTSAELTAYAKRYMSLETAYKEAFQQFPTLYYQKIAQWRAEQRNDTRDQYFQTQRQYLIQASELLVYLRKNGVHITDTEVCDLLLPLRRLIRDRE